MGNDHVYLSFVRVYGLCVRKVKTNRKMYYNCKRLKATTHKQQIKKKPMSKLETAATAYEDHDDDD